MLMNLQNNSEFTVAPLRDEHIAAYRDLLGVVAGEGRYICITEVPSLEASEAFIRLLRDGGYPVTVALCREEVVGWCSIKGHGRSARNHCGVLGMGVHPLFRGQGAGKMLMEDIIKRCREMGLERIELEAFSSNERAIALYRKFGFEEEGCKKRAVKLNGRYDDLIEMARFL